MTTARPGLGRGSLTVVGTGYGGDVTSAAAAALGRADVVIGHPDFVAEVRHLIRQEATCFDVVDGAEPGADIFTLRTTTAVDHARRGAHVVLISGGDPGLLGMAGPVLGALPEDVDPSKVRVLPGLSAWQYAGATLGAPFNRGLVALPLCLYHDDDDSVMTAVDAAARSGLGISAYMLRHNGEENPAIFPTAQPPTEIARRRFEMLHNALLAHRPANTPAVLVTGLGEHDGPRITTMTIARLDRLWPLTTPTSVLCAPGRQYVQRGGKLWVET